MPANSFSGQRELSVTIAAQASYDYARTQTYADVVAIPGGGTVLQLPDEPRDCDWYEWGNTDNSCAVARPITLALSAAALGAGVTIQGGASALFTIAGSSGKVVYFDQSRTWGLFVAGSGAPAPAADLVLFLNTAAMTGGSGQAAYVSAAGVASPTDSAALVSSAIVGVYEGTAGQIAAAGEIADALFTTAGGAPLEGRWVWVAAAADDGGTAAGKFTATPPLVGYETGAGVCLDASAYAGAKRAKITLLPQPPIKL